MALLYYCTSGGHAVVCTPRITHSARGTDGTFPLLPQSSIETRQSKMSCSVSLYPPGNLVSPARLRGRAPQKRRRTRAQSAAGGRTAALRPVLRPLRIEPEFGVAFAALDLA